MVFPPAVTRIIPVCSGWVNGGVCIKVTGGALLEAVHEMSDLHGEATGVYLETARPENVALYRHFGYELLGRDKLDDAVDFWYMFRPSIRGSGASAVTCVQSALEKPI